jgi:ribosomal protein S27AE
MIVMIQCAASKHSILGEIIGAAREIRSATMFGRVKDDQTIALLCPRSADQMRLARKLPLVAPLIAMAVYLCGRCGYVEMIESTQNGPL